MITKIKIRNFQKHKKKDIELGKLTTFVGPSDSGKSAIIRALYWAAFNKPSGLAFQRNGSKYTKVYVKLDNASITRTRGKANTYALGQETYKSFGSSPPKPVEKALNVTRENFQLQHDGPFWFNLSPGELSRQLNMIVDLGVIDQSLKNAASLTRQSKSKLSATQELLDQNTAELDELEYVPRLVKDARKIDACQQQSQNKADDIADLRDLVRHLAGSGSRQQSLRQAIKAFQRVQTTHKAYQKTAQQCERLYKLLKDLEAADVSELPFVSTSKLESDAQSWREKQTTIKRLKALTTKLKHNASQQCQTKRKVKSVAAKLPSNCPICGKTLDQPT